MQESWPITLDLAGVMPFMIPIAFLFGAVVLGAVSMVLAAKAKENAHRERMFLAEKGLEIPDALYGNGPPEKKKSGDFRGARAFLIVMGILCIVIGAGVWITIGVQDGFDDGVGAIIPILIGVGLIVSERMILRVVVQPNVNAVRPNVNANEES